MFSEFATTRYFQILKDVVDLRPTQRSAAQQPTCSSAVPDGVDTSVASLCVSDGVDVIPDGLDTSIASGGRSSSSGLVPPGGVLESEDDKRVQKYWVWLGRTGIWCDPEAADGFRRSRSRSRTPPGIRHGETGR